MKEAKEAFMRCPRLGQTAAHLLKSFALWLLLATPLQAQLEPRSALYENLNTTSIKWRHWTTATFQEAAEQHKLLLVFLAQSHCRECIVYRERLFSDPKIKSYLTTEMIPVAVDTDEVPHLADSLRSTVKKLSGRGFWPAVMILTPDRKAMAAGARSDPAQLLQALNTASLMWRRADSPEVASLLTKNSRDLDSPIYPPAADKVDLSFVNGYVARLIAAADPQTKGFGRRSKRPYFLHHMAVNRLINRNKSLAPLMKHSQGTMPFLLGLGINDHVGGGFFTATADPGWALPFTEKLLVTSAEALLYFVEGYQITRSDLFKKAAQGVYGFIESLKLKNSGLALATTDFNQKREIAAPYLWTTDEIKQGLTKQQARLLLDKMSLLDEGNIPAFPITEQEKEAGFHQLTKANLPRLHFKTPLTELYSDSLQSALAALAKLAAKKPQALKRQQLYVYDNALAAAALSRYAWVMNQPSAAVLAQDIVGFILQEMWKEKQGLHRVHYKGKTFLNAQLRDYAALVFACTELFISSGETHILDWALSLNEDIFKLFQDKKTGLLSATRYSFPGFYWPQVAASDSNGPSGASLTIYNSRRLADLSGDEKLAAAARTLVMAYLPIWNQAPHISAFAIQAFDYFSDQSKTVLMLGPKGKTRNIARSLSQSFLPNTVWAYGQRSSLQNLGILRLVKSTNFNPNKVELHLCSRGRCQLLQDQKTAQKTLFQITPLPVKLPPAHPGTILAPKPATEQQQPVGPVRQAPSPTGH